MGAHRLLWAAMNRVGKPMSRLEEIARLLRATDGAAQQGMTTCGVSNAASDAFPVTDSQRPVYAGEPVAFEDDRLVFDSFVKVTKRLDFRPDRYGYLVNGEGLVLMGRSDAGDDTRGGLRLMPIRLQDGPAMPARATTGIRYKANLPSQPLAPRAGSMGGSDHQAAGDTPELAAGALAGGDIRVFDGHGRAAIIRLRWLKTHHASTDGFDGWQLLYHVQDSPLVLRAGVRGWHEAGDVLRFDGRGRMISEALITLTLGHGLEPVELDFGRSGLTQFPDSTGLVKVLTCAQNGWPQASLREIAIRSDGRVLGSFDNGRVELLGVAAFATPEGEQDLQQAA